jgi:hypothetical protein
LPAILWQDVEALQPNLSTVSAAAQMIFLALVNEDLNPTAFGGEDSVRYHLARCYLAAHLGELERRRGVSGGPVQSKTIGTSSITIAYATAMSSSDDVLRTTTWGSAYADMLLASPLRLGLTSGPASWP